MASLDPIQLLEKILNEHEIALTKSINSYKMGLIDDKTHIIYKENLRSLIDKYKYAIQILKK